MILKDALNFEGYTEFNHKTNGILNYRYFIPLLVDGLYPSSGNKEGMSFIFVLGVIWFSTIFEFSSQYSFERMAVWKPKHTPSPH